MKSPNRKNNKSEGRNSTQKSSGSYNDKPNFKAKRPGSDGNGPERNNFGKRPSFSKDSGPGKSYGSDERSRSYGAGNSSEERNGAERGTRRNFSSDRDANQRPFERRDNKAGGGKRFGDNEKNGSSRDFGNDRPSRSTRSISEKYDSEERYVGKNRNEGPSENRERRSDLAKRYGDHEKGRFSRNDEDSRSERPERSRPERPDSSERSRPFERRESKPFGQRESKSFERRESKPFERREGASSGEKRFGSNERAGSARSFDKSSDERPKRPAAAPKKGAYNRTDKRKPSNAEGSGERNREGGYARESSFAPIARKPFSNDRGEIENKGYSKKKVLAYRKKHEDEGMIRLNKYISNSGVCSRREADTHIMAGVVTVNGKVVTELGYKVAIDDVVKYDGATLNREKPVYLLLNKPKDYITTLDDPGNRKTVMELIVGACKERVYPVGRLDRNTTGLLLFTNDGDLAKKLTHPKYGVKKIYHVETDKPVKKSDLDKMLSGIELEDGQIVIDEASYVSTSKTKKEVGVVLHSGKNRIVRRVFEHLGYEVEKLDRVFFAGLDKKRLPRGKWRILSEKEVNLLKMNLK
jgi:23S rRNA pseudouridine2605 synthase